MYKIEIHAHTSEVSPCSRLTAAELVHAYENAGYAGLMITDHYQPKLLPHLREQYPDMEPQEAMLLGYRAAKAAAKTIRVYFGCELRFPGSENDYLLYGIDEQFILDNPLCCMGSCEEFLATYGERYPGMLFIQAHPLRDRLTFKELKYLHGYEVMNGNYRHNSRNSILCDKLDSLGYKDYVRTSGSDAHMLEDVANGGILSDTLPETSAGVAELLRSGSYTLIDKLPSLAARGIDEHPWLPPRE